MQEEDCELLLGSKYTFDRCLLIANSHPPLHVFYSLRPDAPSGRILMHGGLRLEDSHNGWAGLGLGSSQMIGSNAVIVTRNISSPTGEAIIQLDP